MTFIEPARLSGSLVILFCLAGILFGQTPAGAAAGSAAGASATAAKDPFAMDLDTLFNTKVTTASKFSESLTDAAGVVTVVTEDEIRRFGGTTVMDVLSRVAGISVSSSFLGDTTLVTIRGDQTRANAGHILFLINGRPAREILEGGVSSDILESFPLAILERIEVVKGPGSVLYGSAAFAGVINLITRKSPGHTGEDVHGSVSEGAAGERSASEEILFQRGDFRLVEAAQVHEWPRWSVTYRDQSFGGVSTIQNAVLRNEGTGAYLGLYYKGLSFTSSYTAQETPSFIGGAVGDTRLKRGFSNLGYALRAKPKWDMTFDFTWSKTIFQEPDIPYIQRDSYEGDLEWTNFVALSERDHLTFGLAYNHIAGTELFTGITPAVADTQGSRDAGEAYVQYERKLTDNIKLVGGVQANKIGAIGLKAVPRGGIVWSPTNRTALKVLYGGAYNAPSLIETLIQHPSLQGNPHLLSEQVGTLDVQFAYRTHRFQSTVDYFNSRSANLIILKAAVAPATYYNAPSADHYNGGEAEAKYYLKHEWFLTASGTYLVDRTAPGADDLSPGSDAVLKAGISYLNDKGSSLGVFDVWQSHVDGYGSTLNPAADAFHSFSAHARYDLSRRWFKDDTRGFAVFLNADNLLNHPLWFPALGSGFQNTIPVVRGRTVFFGLEVWQKKVR